MMINKNRFRISNDKKVLHKIGKRWVTVSALTLALLGGAAAASTVTTHADATTIPAVEAQHTDNVKKQINSNLNSAANSNNAKSTTASAQSDNATKPSAVQSSAANMHNALLQNAANQKPSAKSAGGSIASNAPIHQSAQPNSAYEAYLKQNPQLAHAYSDGATNSNNQNNQKANVAKKRPLIKASGEITIPPYTISDNTMYITGNMPSLQNQDFFIGVTPSNWTPQYDASKDKRSYKNVSKIVFQGGTAPSDATGLFAFMPNLQSVEGNGFDTSNTKDMKWMFFDDGNLKNVDGLADWNMTKLDDNFPDSTHTDHVTVQNGNRKSPNEMAFAGVFNGDGSLQYHSWYNAARHWRFGGEVGDASGSLPSAKVNDTMLLAGTPLAGHLPGNTGGNGDSPQAFEYPDGKFGFDNDKNAGGVEINPGQSAANSAASAVASEQAAEAKQQASNATNFTGLNDRINSLVSELASYETVINASNVASSYASNSVSSYATKISASLSSAINAWSWIHNNSNSVSTASNSATNADNWVNNNGNIVSNNAKNGSNKADTDSNTINTDSTNASNEANSAETAASNSANQDKDSLANSISASLSAASSALDWIKSSGNSAYNNASNGSAQANSNSGWIHSNSGSLSNASTEASEASTSANANSSAINGIKNVLSNYSTVSADAVNAMSSLNADKNELSWLANSESALSTGSSQASSNAGWIANNSASVSALSGEWTSVNARISNDSKALNDAINAKADNASLTADYSKLSGDISTASGLANAAKQLATKNSGEISNLKANTAITFTFTQDGSNVLIPVTMTNGYIEANAQSHSGNTYDITNLLDNAVASKGKHAVGTYTVTLGNDKNGDATLNFKAQPQKKFGVGMVAPSADNGMTTFKLGTPAQQRRAWNFVQYGLNNHKGLILGATNQVPSSNDTAHNVVLANNQAEYKGDIILNFGSHQTKVPFDTGSTNPKVLASDSVNLLNYAQNAQNPSDFTKDNLINGFDTTGFKFDSETSTPNNQYNFTIQPSDATNQTGADVHSNYNITLNYTAQPVTENIQYVYGSHIENVNKTTTTAKGNDDSQGSWNSTSNLKPGWTLATTDNKFTFTNNGTAKINVAPAQTTDTINYVDQQGNKVGSQQFTGNNYQATDAGHNNVDVTKDNDTNLDKNYKLKNADNSFRYDGSTYTVNVIGNARSPKNTVPSSTKPSDANNPKSNKSMAKPNGDSDVLFTINVRDYNADGTKEINHYTKYVTESGEVGDPFTIKASDYLTNGFNIDTSKSADKTVSGTISDNQLQPNSVTFDYYAKASSFDPNKAKTDPNYVKKYNADPTTPKPITVQYIGELNGKSNQVVKTYSNVITGDTGDTGTLSNIENAASVPTGYTVKGNSYNYTITTDPQTIKVNLNSKTAKQMNNGNQNYKPATPSDKPSSKVPSDNTVKKDAKHGFVTVIINENVDGKLAHQSAQTVDESNLGVGDSYTIEPTNFTPKGYQVNSNDKALTGTVNPDGSLSNGSATFTYDVNSNEIAPITVTYYNQYGDRIDVNTGKSRMTGDSNVTNSDATVTITSAQLATKGAIGDYVDITGFLTAPKGHHFNKNIIDSSSNNLDHVQLQQAKDNLPVHLGLTLFEAMPKPQPKPTPKPKSNSSASTITPASASAEIQSAASSAAQSASASASASAASAEQSAVNSAANSAAQDNGSAVTSTEQSMAKADASNEAHDDAVASAARSAAGSAEASAAVSAADEVRSAEADHNDSKTIASVKASAASAERSAAKSAAQSAKASATDSVEDSIASSEDNQEVHANRNSEAPSEPVEHGGQMIGDQNAEPSHEANVQREAASHMVGVSNKLAQPSTTVHASRVGSNDQNASGRKLPQTNEAEAAGLMGASAIMAALGLAGTDVDRKRRRE